MPKNPGFNSVRGEYSYKKNPAPKPKMTPYRIGPSSNPDAMKANKLLQKQHKGRESIRGKGM